MSTITMPMMSDEPLPLGDQPQAGVTPRGKSFCDTGDDTTDEEMQKTHDLQMRLMAP